MITAHSPKWGNAEHTEITLYVAFPWLTSEVQFTARGNDSEAHGRALFARASAGEFGPIAAFVAPPVLPPSTATSLQFMDRFTEDEQLAIVTATLASPVIKLWYDKLIAATEIIYADARLLAGMNALVAAGLITQERMDVILPPAWRSSL